MVTKVAEAGSAVGKKRKEQRVVDDPTLTAAVREYAEMVWSVASVERIEAYLDGCALYVVTVTNQPSDNDYNAIFAIEKSIDARYPDLDWRGRISDQKGFPRASNAYTDLLLYRPSN